MLPGSGFIHDLYFEMSVFEARDKERVRSYGTDRLVSRTNPL